MRKNEEEQSAKLIRFMSSILLGGVLALAVCLVFLFLCSVGICRSRTLVMGLCVGAVLFLLLLTAGLLFYPGMSIEEGGVGLLCACLIGGALAGLLGGKPKKKRRK